MRSLCWLALGVLSIAACGASIEDLEPFPCALDTTCPASLACVPGVGCAPATVDAMCSATTDCGAAGAGISCQLGLCAPSCSAASDCGAGRVCSALSSTGTCLLDCSAGQSCPAGLSCQDLWYGGRRGCTVPQTSLLACTELAAIGPTRSCGKENFTTPCAAGSFCPADSYCSGSSQCTCNPGFVARSCDGQICAGACAYPNWWCIPSAVAQACPQTSSWSPQAMHCADGRVSPSECATPERCTEWCSMSNPPCDTVTQNCLAAATAKCSLVSDASGNGLTSCVAVLGNGAPGDSCQRSGDGTQGLDDCRIGSFCTAFGSAAGTRTCRQFCRRSSQCATSEHCVDLSGLIPADGVCLPDCQLFSGCPSQMSCTPIVDLDLGVVGFCRAIGSGAAGSACADDIDCDANLLCRGPTGSAVCTPLCDSAHPCATGTCNTLHNTTLTSGAGYCG